MNNNNEVLLKVEHLEQHFKLGKKTLKAVDDVNFEIKKGEVFGLVGESGCGKTTTGRSIIRLYDITGGSVYFDGKRICAGIRPYKQAISDAKKLHKENVKSYTAEYKNAVANGVDEIKAKDELTVKTNKSLEQLIEVVQENTELIKSAKYDHKNCNKEFAKFLVENVHNYYTP